MESGQMLTSHRLTAARIIFAATWKNEFCAGLEGWKDMVAGYATMAKLIT